MNRHTPSHPQSRRRAASGNRIRTRNGAFTLVELMVVIIIIGILAGLLSVAAYNAVVAARRAKVKSEIDNMDMVLQKYATDRGEVPPCLADRDPASENPTRQISLISHLRTAFPRFTIVPLSSPEPLSYSGPNKNTGLRKYVKDNYGTRNIDDIDAAEALVLWLGGPPDPNIAPPNKKLLGWSANVSNPFQPAGARADSGFAFNETRLTDYDQDGWYEYIPDVSSSGTPVAPYVYFDATNYSKLQSYPTSSPMFPKNPGAAAVAQWGVVVPYLSKYDAATPKNSTWVNPKKFQIISAGADSVYSLEAYAGPSGAAQYPVFPIGSNYQQGDDDNLTNFSPGALKDERP